MSLPTQDPLLDREDGLWVAKFTCTHDSSVHYSTVRLESDGTEVDANPGSLESTYSIVEFLCGVYAMHTTVDLLCPVDMQYLLKSYSEGRVR